MQIKLMKQGRLCSLFVSFGFIYSVPIHVTRNNYFPLKSSLYCIDLGHVQVRRSDTRFSSVIFIDTLCKTCTGLG